MCEKDFTDNPASFTFASATFPPGTPIVLNGLYLNAAGTEAFAVTNSQLTSNQSTRIASINISNITGSAPNFIAKLNILFNNTIVSRSPVATDIQLSVATAGANYVLTGCLVRPNGSGGPVDSQAICEAMGGFWTVPGGGRPNFCLLPTDTIDDL